MGPGPIRTEPTEPVDPADDPHEPVLSEEDLIQTAVGAYDRDRAPGRRTAPGAYRAVVEVTSGDTSRTATVTSLSSAGVLFAMAAPYPLDAPVRFSLPLPAGRAAVEARVSRVVGDGAGAMEVRFQQLDDATRAAIDRLVAVLGRSP